MRTCCVVHDHWCMLFFAIAYVGASFYCLHVDMNVLVLVCLQFLYVLICECVLVQACLCVHGIRMWYGNLI